MPGYIIHLTEAKIIFDLLKTNLGEEFLNEEWLEKFSYGSLLPDAVDKKCKFSSHFWIENPEELESNLIMVPQIKKWLAKYPVTLKEPVLLGYLAHLDLDLKYWSGYAKKYVKFLDSDGNITENRNHLEKVFVKKGEKFISPEEFFSSDFLYGDYTKLNQILIKKYAPKIPSYSAQYKGVIEEVHNEDMRVLLDKLNFFMKEGKKLNENLCVFSSQEFERFIEKKAKQFVDEYATQMKII